MVRHMKLAKGTNRFGPRSVIAQPKPSAPVKRADNKPERARDDDKHRTMSKTTIHLAWATLTVCECALGGGPQVEPAQTKA